MVIEGRALSWGISIYLLLYLLHILVLPLLVGERVAGSDNQGLLYAINQVLGLATCLVPGFIAARKAGHHGFMHGGIVGSVSTILTALLAMLWAIVAGSRFYGLETMPFWIVINGFLGAFAGLIATNMEEDKHPI